MRTVTLANGAEYTCDWAHVDGDLMDLNVVTPATMPELAAAFGDPANTARIVLSHPEGPRIYEGYTDLRVLNAGGWAEGATLIILKKEA